MSNAPRIADLEASNLIDQFEAAADYTAYLYAFGAVETRINWMRKNAKLLPGGFADVHEAEDEFARARAIRFPIIQAATFAGIKTYSLAELAAFQSQATQTEAA